MGRVPSRFLPRSGGTVVCTSGSDKARLTIIDRYPVGGRASRPGTRAARSFVIWAALANFDDPIFLKASGAVRASQRRRPSAEEPPRHERSSRSIPAVARPLPSVGCWASTILSSTRAPLPTASFVARQSKVKLPQRQDVLGANAFSHIAKRALVKRRLASA